MLGLVAALAACGDDEKGGSDQGPPSGADGGGEPTGSGGRPIGSEMDGGLGLDAGTADGRILGDGGAFGDDGGCDVVDPRFGCGRGAGTWVRFANGLELDRTRGLVWAPTEAPSGDHGDDAYRHCQELTIAGVSDFDLPTIDEVRTLAAGCPATAQGGSCRVAHESCVGPECGLDQAACAPCEPGRGPHPSGGYCRPELSECVTSWVLTSCDDNGVTESCPVHRHWYYDVRTGGFGLSEPSTQLAGRCVSRLPSVQ